MKPIRNRRLAPEYTVHSKERTVKKMWLVGVFLVIGAILLIHLKSNAEKGTIPEGVMIAEDYETREPYTKKEIELWRKENPTCIHCDIWHHFFNKVYDSVEDKENTNWAELAFYCPRAKRVTTRSSQNCDKMTCEFYQTIVNLNEGLKRHEEALRGKDR